MEEREEQVRIGEQRERVIGSVLSELDQNCMGQDSMNLIIRKRGSWKRKARANTLNVGKENEIVQEGEIKPVSSKRGFELSDEVDILQGAVLKGKRVKMDETRLQNMDIMVDVASQNWPQSNQ